MIFFSYFFIDLFFERFRLLISPVLIEYYSYFMFHWIFNNCLIQGKCVISRIPSVCGSAAIHRNLRNDWPHRKSRRLNYYHYLWNPSRCKRASPYPVISRGYIECKFVLIQGAKEKEGGEGVITVIMIIMSRVMVARD